MESFKERAAVFRVCFDSNHLELIARDIESINILSKNNILRIRKEAI